MDDSDETRTQNHDALLEDALAATLDSLGDLPDSPRVRDLRARVESYRRTLARWSAVKPSADQRAALRELVLDLRTRALDLRASAAATPHQGVPSARRPTER